MPQQHVCILGMGLACWPGWRVSSMAGSVPWNTDCHRALGAVPILCLDLALAAQHSAANSLQARLLHSQHPVCGFDRSLRLTLHIRTPVSGRSAWEDASGPLRHSLPLIGHSASSGNTAGTLGCPRYAAFHPQPLPANQASLFMETGC